MNPDWTILTITFPDDAKLQDARALKRRIKADGAREPIEESKAVPFPDVTDRGGVRIEDTLMVTAARGPELLTRFPKELAIL